jgi:hypothetical protein
MRTCLSQTKMFQSCIIYSKHRISMCQIIKSCDHCLSSHLYLENQMLGYYYFDLCHIHFCTSFIFPEIMKTIV